MTKLCAKRCVLGVSKIALATSLTMALIPSSASAQLGSLNTQPDEQIDVNSAILDDYQRFILNGNNDGGLVACPTPESPEECAWNAIDFSLFAPFVLNKGDGWGRNGGPILVTFGGTRPIFVQANGGNGQGGSDGIFGSGDPAGLGGDGGLILLTSLSDIDYSCIGVCAGIYAEASGGNGGAGGDGGLFGSGAEGAQGGRGGSVSVTNNGAIRISALLFARGIVARANGGRGGDGGDGALFIGGGGGSGAPTSGGGTVNVVNNGDISVSAAVIADGILASSVGGFGGDGGGGALLGGGGGDGGSGGFGGAITVENNASITVTGLNGRRGILTRGIFAQSVGGGGGDGGSSVSIVALGGAGGAGGSGGRVTITNSQNGSIMTRGVNSDAIFAQSVGGGGGNGGNALGALAIGGSGGGGGSADFVRVTNAGEIATDGVASRGIFAQSVGGGGGNGGNGTAVGPGVAVAIGGSGGQGGNGGTVFALIEDTSNIATLGRASHGVQVQSVGGGGGDGGQAISIAIDPTATTGAIGVALGGSGSAAGSGRNATVQLGGSISTLGDASYGVFAQSIGGGGGNGGGAITGTASGGVNIGVSLGGSGASGGGAGIAGATGNGIIETSGTLSHGIVVQSIGGGGGNGGLALSGSLGGIGGNITLGGSGARGGQGGFSEVIFGLDPESQSVIITRGIGAMGIFAQSIGGGGGNGGFAGSFAVGSTSLGVSLGGAGGFGTGAGTVNVRNGATIVTENLASTAIMAQSIGGGGGNGGGAVSASGGVVTLNTAIGGNGGPGGFGGNVQVFNSGEILTLADNSRAIMAQSIGGGGGDGGFAVAGGIAISVGDAPSGAVSIAIGGNGGAGSNGGEVTLDNEGAITTLGASSTALTALSIGGGGGDGGWSGAFNVSESASLAIAFGGRGGDGGSAGEVRVTNAADITAMGEGSGGIIAMSLGGGGGNGGFALSATAGGVGSKNFGLSVGGNGGSGGAAESVTVENLAGTITTEGRIANAITAMSTGGGGGNGGFALSGILSLGGNETGLSNSTINAALSIGGNGGTGNEGGDVNVLNRGVLATTGEGSRAIFAQSVGGGGGNGGLALTTLLALNANKEGRVVNASFAVGGDGGSGNVGGDVTVTQEGVLSTTGLAASALIARSVGGSGGNGGDAGSISFLFGLQCALPVACSPAKETQNNVSLQLTFGGDGGSGNHGGIVDVSNDGMIVTEGLVSHGIMAQSVGGGGGGGGDATIGFSAIPFEQTPIPDEAGTAGSLLLLVTNQAKFANNLRIGVGGTGGSSGDGNFVSIDNQGTIAVSDLYSHAIFAQSIGGGGGSGGNAAVGVLGTVGIGGTGGASGSGGDIDITNGADAVILAEGGAFSSGIVAQSIGGGGGQSGSGSGLLAIGGGASFDDLPFFNGPASTGNGGAIDIDNFGTVWTTGNVSSAIHAQSIGGGGGIGGGSGLNIVAIGGDGGAGGNGDLVEIDNDGLIVAEGNSSHGIWAQSIGGGGGAGGGDDFDTRIFDIYADFSVDDLEAIEASIFAEIGTYSAIGGFIGDRVSDVLNNDAAVLAVIGAGGAAGDGGEVIVENDGTVMLSGDHGHAVFAQSIGGGGGSTGGATSLGLIGAQGGNGGDGDSVTVVNSADAMLSTTGLQSSGIVAQSIGGGGGSLGDVQTVFGFGDSASASAAIGTGGDGGVVLVDNFGSIVTTGANASGILAQSLGGGGGLSTLADDAQFAERDPDAAAGGTGDGREVRVTHLGAIQVTGANSAGIRAQSIGGGGGLVTRGDGIQFAGSLGGEGIGGPIFVNIEGGSIIASGAGGVGVWAQTEGGTGSDLISIRNEEGYIRGGSGDGAGIWVQSQFDNLIFNSGTLSAISGWAVISQGGDDTVTNTGMLIGNLDLGAGSNSLLNDVNASFVGFDTIDLVDPVPGFQSAAAVAAPGNFENSGTFYLGLGADIVPIDLLNGAVFANNDLDGPAETNLLFGARVITNVDVDGNFVQTSLGRSVFDVAYGPYGSDTITVSGFTSVAGVADVTLTWLENIDNVVLIQTAGTATNNGLQIADTIAIDYDALATGRGIELAITPDFGQSFLNSNGRAIGGHMDSALSVGGASGIGRLLALMGNLPIGEEDQYSTIMTELNPEPLLLGLVQQFESSRVFANRLNECAYADRDSADGCLWGGIRATDFDREGSFENFAADASITSLAAGYEKRLGANFAISGGIGIDLINSIRVDSGRASSDGEALNLGLSAEYQGLGGLSARVSVSGGWQSLDTTRGLNVFNPLIAASEQESRYLRAGGRLAYRLELDRFFIEPAVTGSITDLSQDDLVETGAMGLGVSLTDFSEVITSAGGEVSLGLNFVDNETQTGSFVVTAGYETFSDEVLVANSRFIGADASAAPARIMTPFNDSRWYVEGGLSLVGEGAFGLRMNYRGEFGDIDTIHSGSVEATLRF